ncbi:MAG: HAD-IC family P-type ATPase, partial [Actinobacteria bacterium]|nr:HAD-IC family P-type ATPase [Actinomycetota bacterium]
MKNIKNRKVDPRRERADGTAWYALSVDECEEKLGVDPASGLSSDEAGRRLEQYGSNKLFSAGKESIVIDFLRQYKPLMQIVLLGAAAVSIIIGDLSTMGLLVGVTVFNAILGLVQERKAERSIDALGGMMVDESHVRRDGKVVSIPAEQLVPGDIVIIREGDRVPADGRLISVATLEVEESALTGESAPVPKDPGALGAAETALGDRTNMVFQNTQVT